jgi:CBS domain-containing protein
VVSNGDLVGIVCLHDIRAVDRRRWDDTTVSAIMTPRDKLLVASPQEETDEALNKMQGGDHRQLPVVENSHLVGILRRRDIMRYLQLQADGHELG